jgi:hypothetical protein
MTDSSYSFLGEYIICTQTKWRTTVKVPKIMSKHDYISEINKSSELTKESRSLKGEFYN